MAALAHNCCEHSLKTSAIIIAVLYVIWSVLEIALTANRLHSLPYEDATDRPLHKVGNDSVHHETHGTDISMQSLATHQVPGTKALLIAGLVLAIIQAICGTLLFFGAIKEIPDVLFPWVVVQTFVVIASAVIDVLTCIVIIPTPAAVAGSIIGIVLSIFYVVLSVHFLRIVYGYYLALRENPKFYLIGKEAEDREGAKM